MECKIDYCLNTSRSLGLCEKHYTRQRRNVPNWEQPNDLDLGDFSCIIEGCAERRSWRKMCGKHEYRSRVFGDASVELVKDLPSDEIFWTHVEVTGFCWNWTGFTNPAGYGRCMIREAVPSQLAHRSAYEILVGPIPKGLVLDHLCRNRVCVNPDHLDPVTRAENNRRGMNALGAKDFCRKAGHDMRLYAVTQGGRRRCSECERIRSRDRSKK